jgi:hypothetical protein
MLGVNFNWRRREHARRRGVEETGDAESGSGAHRHQCHRTGKVAITGNATGSTAQWGACAKSCVAFKHPPAIAVAGGYATGGRQER